MDAGRNRRGARRPRSCCRRNGRSHRVCPRCLSKHNPRACPRRFGKNRLQSASRYRRASHRDIPVTADASRLTSTFLNHDPPELSDIARGVAPKQSRTRPKTPGLLRRARNDKSILQPTESHFGQTQKSSTQTPSRCCAPRDSRLAPSSFDVRVRQNRRPPN